MQVSELRERLTQIESFAQALRATPGAAATPALREALDVYDRSMQQAVRQMLHKLDGAKGREVDVTAMVAELDGKIDSFLKVAARCPAMQMFQAGAKA